MAEERRSRGTVVTFRDQKGYGFIKPEDGGAQAFVHQTAIKTEGFQTLHEGQEVEFIVIEKGGRYQATDITGQDGAPLESARGGGRGYNCPSGGRGSGGGGSCFNYGQQRHLARDCNGGGGGGGGYGSFGGGGSRKFYECGQLGHFARECNQNSTHT